MALTPAAPQLQTFLESLREVYQLMEMHSVLAGSGPGRKHHVEVLNKSAIVLVVACWEAYVEDLVKSTLEVLIKTAKNHTSFPKTVLERVGSKNSGINAWNLAGDGWRAALNDNLSEVLAKTTGTLNTPKTAQVDELFLKALGHPQLSGCWSWSGRTAIESSKALDDLVSLRGAIAHRVKHSRPVRKSDVQNAIELVSRLAAKSNNEVRKFVHQLSGQHPWSSITYKGTK